MRKAFWPLVVALGLLVAFGAITTGGIQTVQAEITTDGDGPAVWWFLDAGDFGEWPPACNDDDARVAAIKSNTSKIDQNDVIWLFLEEDDEVWICVDLGDTGNFDTLEFDTNNYGTWEGALCRDSGDSPFVFEEGEDECEGMIGEGSNTLTIDCEDEDVCEAPDDDSGDVAALFVCEDEAGEAEITITHGEDSNAGVREVHFRIICWNEADEGVIKAAPTKVEIVPALGSTQYSLIWVKLLDEDGNPAAPGREVTWMTDNCEVSDANSGSGHPDSIQDVLDADDKSLDTFDEVIAIFTDYVANPTPGTADDIADFVDLLDPDWDDETEEETFIEEPFDLDDPFEDIDTFTAVVLNCGQGHDATPGVANVTAIVEVEDGADLVFKVAVTVVGPPATAVVAADETSVRCGERVQITVTVKDAKGQNVSDHTLVEAVTNFGGVLGGTGAVAGQQGLVTPISSTLAETFNGVATFWLLTSETHSGPYEVLISTGGGGAVAGSWFDEHDENQLLGGLFSTPVINGRVSVACTIPAAAAPAPAATVRAPSTGQGIVPPNTGDAGLADASGSSSILFVIAGVAVFSLAGVAGLKFARK